MDSRNGAGNGASEKIRGLRRRDGRRTDGRTKIIRTKKISAEKFFGRKFFQPEKFSAEKKFGRTSFSLKIRRPYRRRRKRWGGFGGAEAPPGPSVDHPLNLPPHGRQLKGTVGGEAWLSGARSKSSTALGQPPKKSLTFRGLLFDFVSFLTS